MNAVYCTQVTVLSQRLSCKEAKEFVKQELIITHYYHSGFSAAWGRTLVVFDYWRGSRGEVSGKREITPEKLSAFDQVFVLISHEHPDHLDPIVYTWKDYANVTYLVSSDMPVGTRGRRMAPGDTAELAENLTVTAFPSTDLGVSFLVRMGEVNLFHAGDLNFWHWRDESLMSEIEEAEAEFRKAIEPISKEQVDIAFFPVDPRQGSMFEAGANYFILTVKPRILIPMHYFHRAEVAVNYARTASCRSTEVIALPRIGEQMGVQVDDDGYLNLFRPKMPGPVPEGAPNGEEGPADPSQGQNADVSPESVEEDLLNNPFRDSDLPIPQLSEEENPPEENSAEENTADENLHEEKAPEEDAQPSENPADSPAREENSTPETQAP